MRVSSGVPSLPDTPALRKQIEQAVPRGVEAMSRVSTSAVSKKVARVESSEVSSRPGASASLDSLLFADWSERPSHHLTEHPRKLHDFHHIRPAIGRAIIIILSSLKRSMYTVDPQFALLN